MCQAPERQSETGNRVMKALTLRECLQKDLETVLQPYIEAKTSEELIDHIEADIAAMLRSYMARDAAERVPKFDIEIKNNSFMIRWRDE